MSTDGSNDQSIQSRIHYGPTCEEIVIDSTQPLESVLLQVKTAVWKKL